MKTFISALATSMALLLAVSAAPRLVVSTASLVPESDIDLVFDSPVVDGPDLGEPVENTWLDIKPALPGKLIWKARNIASFKPDGAPAIGASYTFSIPAGRKHLDGTEIPAGPIATVASESFRPLTANIRNRWTQDYTPATAQWLVVFNDAVDPAKAEAFAYFFADGDQRVPASFTPATVSEAGYFATSYRPWKERASATPPARDQNATVPNVVLVTPANPLPVGKNWHLVISNNLPNADNTATITQAVSYKLGDVEPFEIKEIEAVTTVNEPRSIVIRFNQKLPDALPPSFLTEGLAISPAVENLNASVEGRDIHLSGEFSAHDKWKVTVKTPLASATGLALSDGMTEETTFKRLEPELAIASQDEAQLAVGGRVYPVQTINIRKLDVRMKSLTGTDLIRAAQGYRHYSGKGPDWKSIEPTAPLPYSLVGGKTIAEKTIELDGGIDTSADVTLKWDDLLPAGTRHASLFLDITGEPHEQAGTEGRRNVQALIQLTDIGLAWKLTQSEAFIYAFSCETGQPLPGVTLTLFGEDAARLDSARTDASGLVSLPRHSDTRHLHATLAGDSYITAFDSTLSTVGMWHFPVRYSWMKPAASERRAFLFTDRSLYRPGETVRLKGIVRTQRGNAIEAAEGGPAQVVILDPTENILLSQPVTFSANGSFDLSYQLPDGKTGPHTIRLEYTDELASLESIEDWQEREQISASAAFEIPLRVEEFRRNAFEVTQTIASPAPGATTVEATIDAQYYQGQPVAAGSVKHFTRISERNLYPERYRDFLFGNHRRDDWSYWYHYFGYRWDNDHSGSTSVQHRGDATLTADGKAAIEIPLPQADFPTAREVTVSSEITDANNQTLTSVTKTTVDPASVYIGVSRNDRLIRTGQELPLKLVAVTPAGEPYPEPVTLTATISREVNQAVKSRNDSGATVTENDSREDTLLTEEITLDPAASAREGQPFRFTPEHTGLHFLTLRGKDPEGRDFATVTRFHVYGTNEYPWLYEDGLRIKLVSEKKSYQPGDTARVLVLSPIEGTALVTVEREKVLRSFLLPIKADNPVIEIPLGDDDAPNAYVSVLIVKGAAESAREHKEPQLRLGYCELTVENQRDKLAVTLDAGGTGETTTISTNGNTRPAATYRPGDTVTLSGTVTRRDGSPVAGAEVTLYAEDEGTLAVMGYETPDPLAHFHNPRRLDIEAGTSFHTFLSENPEMQSFHNKGFFIGGGGDMSALANLLRKNFDPCATWAPALVTGADGTFTHEFQVPDTLTRYRVIAVVHHEASRFGHAESAIVVNKPLMLEPKAPRFAHEGDTFTPQVLVQNASEHPATWEVTYRTAPLDDTSTTPVCQALGETTALVTLEPGKSTTVSFPTRAITTGEAVLTWSAAPVSLASGELTPALKHSLSDAVENRFEVHYPVPLLRQVKFVKLDATDASQNLLASLDQTLLAGRGQLDIEFSRSPLSQAAGSVDYLLTYPYGCLEQTTSSLIPWLAVDALRPIIPRFAKLSDEKVSSALKSGADRLLSMQLPDGSFSYWPGNQDRVDWATSYAGLALIAAKEKGAPVPDTAISRLARHLTEKLRGAAEETSPHILEEHCSSLWLLARAGHAQHAYQNVLIDRLGDLTPTARYYLALAVNAAGGEKATQTAKAILTSKVPARGANNGWMTWSPNDALSLLAWSQIDFEAPQTTAALDRLLNDRNPYGHWRTTWVNGWSLMAMASYAEKDNTSTETIVLTLNQAAGEPVLIQLDADNPSSSHSFTLGPDLKLTLAGNLPVFARLKLASKPDITPVMPVATNGLSIDRIYEKVNGDGSSEPLDQPAVGDLVRVSLRVTLPADDTRYLVIEDPLAAIFETVNSGFASQSSAVTNATSQNDWRVSHSELRSDRAVFFLDHIARRGTYTLTYLARCTLAGETTAPPAKVEAMYDPEQFALSASQSFTAR